MPRTRTNVSSARPTGTSCPGPELLRGLVPEMPAACEDQCTPRRLDCLDDLVVALRPSRLDERRDARLEREPRTIREREEAVRRDRRSSRVVAELGGLL